MSLPSILIQINNTIHAFPENGELVYKYQPLQNLKNEKDNGDIDLANLRINAKTANVDINEPISLETEVSYDDSINLIINDRKNSLKIVNSRFYVTDDTHYEIADRKGNLDTNIYTSNNFKIEAGLIKTVRSIIKLDFLGVFPGGRLPVGTYNFYFKLADADGNETDFISESGKVVCYIGAINHPSSVRGGLLEENSEKLIKFRLNNLDLAYDYINVYYSKVSGNQDADTIRTYKISDKFRINGLSTEITISGYENLEEISNDDINIQYANFESTKTLTNCQNISFAGNINKNYEVFKKLEKYSLFITPQLSYEESIGNLDYNYNEDNPDIGFEYYNPKNIYYKLGYWDEDIYRFGIVYKLNDYTLSPVFNIRGIKELTDSTTFHSYNITDTLNYGEDFILEGSPNNYENAKGVFKINSSDTTLFSGTESIKPIGIKFNFNSGVVDGGSNGWLEGLKDITKGFFIVRQKRIPTILTQAVGIATSSNSYIPIIKGLGTSKDYFSESFLKYNANNIPKLGSGLFPITNSLLINNNALLCPEASLRSNIFSNFFNSSEFVLKKFKYGVNTDYFYDNFGTNTLFGLGNLSFKSSYNDSINSNLLLIEPGIELINNNYKFCSLAGNSLESWKVLDPILGDLENYKETTIEGKTNDETDKIWSESISKVRGEFSTYIGCSTNNIGFGSYYNIFQKDYDFINWKEYFRIRYNDSSPYMPISDNISWEDLTYSIDGLIATTNTQYRGDCYINTYTQRIITNFIDPELPTNTSIVDSFTWYKNYRIKNADSTIINSSDGNLGTSLKYRKILPLFTYKNVFVPEWKDDSPITDVEPSTGLLEPDTKKFKKYSEANGTFGYTKINRPDLNAVPIGHWVTFKICSNINLALRDEDFSMPEEEAVHKMRRSFHPLQIADKKNKLPESTVINSGISKSLGNKYYFEVPDVPFIKTNFYNRIYYSNVLQESSFKNGNRVFMAKNYQDYTREYGQIIKLVEWYGKLICVMEHGVVMIPVNERAMMTNETGENVYVNTDNVLPKNPLVLSNIYGSNWEDAIVKTPMGIYGIDTIAKKIWKTNGENFEIISDMKIQKFLNDNINLRVVEDKRYPGTNSIKAHYNAFKHDVNFVYVYNGIKWHLSWNELLNKWITQNTWFPEYSENINNIFYTFANNSIHAGKGNTLYKHGFAGGIEESGNILPTYWYDEQHKFEFEFVVIGVQGVQKVFDNLQIISNLAEPDSFYYEIVGEGFDWRQYKNTLLLLGDLSYIGLVDGTQMPSRNIGESDSNYLFRRYQVYLLANTSIKKLPYLWIRKLDNSGLNWPNGNVSRDLTLEQHNKTKENLVSSYQKGLDLKTNGRLKGNMQYLEDMWDIQMQPITFKWAYINSGVLNLSPNVEMKIRDKYIKVRVKYNGTQYAIINAIKTVFTLSYA